MNTYFFKYGKMIFAVLLAVVCFYYGMKDYVNVEKTDIAVVELYGTYPTVSQAEQIWENYQTGDEITDICFVWNGGVQEVINPLYSRQTNVKVTGVVGMAGVYDRQAVILEETDKNGCVIDKNTALELFGSESCVGNQLTVGEDIYEVRGVAAWNQHMLLIRPKQKSLLCTQVMVRGKKRENLENAALAFLVGNGLSGTFVDDSWLDVILPWFPLVFLVMFTMTAAKWGHMFLAADSKWGGSFRCLFFGILLWGSCLFFSVRLLCDIPLSWLPDKWSDFSFWPGKIKKTVEAFRWYIMFLKSMGQVERLISGIGCMIKCGIATLLAGLAADMSV